MSGPPPGMGPSGSSIPPPPPPPGFPTAVYLPPVPPPWTEHRAPGGQPYWFNPQTNVSTYVRPAPLLPPHPHPPPPPPGFQHGGLNAPTYPLAPGTAAAAGSFQPSGQQGAGDLAHSPSQQSSSKQQKKQKKDKPRDKVPIVGTDWIRVTTTLDHVFYTNYRTKTSVWTVPDEIKDVVDDMDKVANGQGAAAGGGGRKRKVGEEELSANGQQGSGAAAAAAAPKDSASTEQEVTAEVETTTEEESRPAVKPPAEEAETVVVEPKKKKAKKTKVVHEIEKLEADEDWQRQIAEEMANEAERADAGGQEQAHVEAGMKKSQDGAVEVKVGAPAFDVSAEEGAALFKAMLAEKDIQPMAPWDMELPKFITDPRYLAVKQLKTRRDLFDEFCKEKIRENRAKKAAEAGGPKVDPLTAYRSLLESAVTSTRTHYSDFKRAHAKDPRFRGFGKTEGEKEKVFKQWLRELGEGKRAEAEKAEQRFFAMLREDRAIRSGDEWAQVKARHASDARYGAVNSSSLRESLFKKHLAGLGKSGGTAAPTQATSNVAASASHQPKTLSKEERAARAAASLREREEQVRAEKERMNRSTNFAKGQLGREEGERDFTTLLVDKITDHEIRWEDATSVLARDSRFTNSPLPLSEQRRLFDAHLRTLYTRRLNLVEGLFESNSPQLTTPFTQVLPHLTSSPHVTALVGQDYDRLEGLYDSWARRRLERARDEFQEMLRESAILEHWGRLRKKAETEGERDGKIGMGEGEGDDSDEDGDVPTLGEMAKQVDEKAIHSVLKNDKRYLQFDHDPDSRNKWVEDYLRQLQAPKVTVHQK